MLILVKLLAKYVVIIYALSSVHEKFGVWIKAAGLGVKNGWARSKLNKNRQKAILTGLPIFVGDGVAAHLGHRACR